MEPKANQTLFVVADLGKVRAFLQRGPDRGYGHLVELELSEQPPALEPLHEQVSDQGGRFPGGRATGEPGGMLLGEGHDKTVEGERRQIEAVARLIEGLVASQGLDRWRLVAPKAINNRLVSRLSEQIRRKLVLNLHADFAKLPIRQLERRLLPRHEGASA